jgi:ABC-type spermidine/putrescine transport system permease subunit II
MAGKKFGISGQWILLCSFCGLVFFFLLMPILIIVPMSFNPKRILEFPPQGFSLKWYLSYFTNSQWIGATLRSFRVALGVSFLSTVVGVLAAFGLVRGQYRGKGFLMAFILSPLIVPVIIKAVSVYYFFSKLHLVGTELGLVLAHTASAIPYNVIIVASTLVNFDESLERASMNLGANRIRTFFHITLPLIRPGLISAALFAFISSFDELIIAIFISGVKAVTLPKMMWDGIRFEVNPTLTAISSILILLSTVLLLSSEYLRKGFTKKGGLDLPR